MLLSCHYFCQPFIVIQQWNFFVSMLLVQNLKQQHLSIDAHVQQGSVPQHKNRVRRSWSKRTSFSLDLEFSLYVCLSVQSVDTQLLQYFHYQIKNVICFSCKTQLYIYCMEGMLECQLECTFEYRLPCPKGFVNAPFSRILFPENSSLHCTSFVKCTRIRTPMRNLLRNQIKPSTSTMKQ